MTKREITGRHVLIGTVAAFGVIIAVNFTMAYQAVGTFPGLEVKNSYVASQKFEARRTAQEALGWQAAAEIEGGVLKLFLTDAEGNPVQPESLVAMVGRPTIARDDRELEFASEHDVLVAPVNLNSGAWILKLTAESTSGATFEKRLEVWVR